MTKKHARAALGALTVATAAAAALPVTATATTYTVSNRLESPVGERCAGTSGCTLRQAVTSANDNPGRDRIEITLRAASTSTSLTISDPVVIVGNRAEADGTLVYSGSGRWLSIVPGAGSVTLADLHVWGGEMPPADPAGGAIRSDGADLTLQRTLFEGNGNNWGDLTAGRGGAIAFSGARTLTVEDSRFVNNQLVGEPGYNVRGGAIHVASGGTLTVSGTQFVRNEMWGVGSNGRGGAIAAEDADVSISGSHFYKNEVAGGNGIGGAISVDGGSLTIVDTILSSNSVYTASSALGGGIAATGGATRTTIVNSSLERNSAMGANGAPSRGGALYVESATTIRSTTFAQNTMLWTGTVGGTIGGPAAGLAPTVALTSSIIASSSGACEGVQLIDGGYNVVDSSSADCPPSASTSVLVDDAKVVPPEDIDGPQAAVVPAASSPAIDIGPASGCADATDMRGIARPQGPRCDAGAIELVPPPPPETTISSGPPADTSSTSASFSFSGSAGTTSLECSLDNAPFAPCSSPRTLTGLADGTHLFRVRARSSYPDQADPTPAGRTWTVDTQAPPKPTVSAPASGALLNSATVAVSGTAEPSSRVTVAVDDEPRTPSATADADGAYVATVDLSDGSHQVTVRTADAAGNVSGDSAPRTVTVDTTPPAAPQVTFGPPARTHARTFSVLFSGETGASFSCNRDGAGWSACVSPQEFTDVAAGPHTLLVRQTDLAGWESAVATVAWTNLADLAAPTFTVVPAAVAANATFAFTRADGTAFSCRVDGGGWSDCASPLTLFGLAQGRHVVAVRTRDDDGGVSPQIEHAFTYDTLAPAAPSITAAPPAETTATAVELSFGGEPGGSFACALDGGGWSGCASPARFDGLALGSHRVFVRQRDTAGNEGAIAEVVFAVVAPAKPVDRPPIEPGTGAPKPGESGGGTQQPGGSGGGSGSAGGGGGAQAKPRIATISAPARAVVRRGQVKLGCALDRGQLRRCTIALYAGRRRVGSGVASFRGDVRSGSVQVRLTAAGRAAARRGARLTARLQAASADGSRLTASRAVRF